MSVRKMKKAVTIRFPAPLPAEIECPICLGNKCVVCEMSGKIKVTVDAKVPIQRHLIIQYIAEHMDEIANELSQKFGLVPDIQTEDMFEVEGRTYELVKISSLGGVVWIAHRIDAQESPRYFKSWKNLQQFKGGWLEG